MSVHWVKADIGGASVEIGFLTRAPIGGAPGGGVVKSLALIDSGPVGLVYPQILELNRESPLDGRCKNCRVGLILELCLPPRLSPLLTSRRGFHQEGASAPFSLWGRRARDPIRIHPQ